MPQTSHRGIEESPADLGEPIERRVTKLQTVGPLVITWRVDYGVGERIELLQRLRVAPVDARLPEDVTDVHYRGQRVRREVLQHKAVPTSLESVIRGVTESRERERTRDVRRRRPQRRA